MRANGFSFMRAWLCLVPLVVCGASLNAFGQVVPSEIVGVSGSLMVTRSGDVIVGNLVAPVNTCCIDPRSTWCLAGNLFASGGGGSGRVAAISEYGQVLSASGDEIEIVGSSCSSLSAYVGYNVWTHTGMTPTPSEEFVAFGGNKGTYCYAVTSLGRVFRRLMKGCDPSCIWVFSGDVNAPTSVHQESMGRLKVRYR